MVQRVLVMGSGIAFSWHDQLVSIGPLNYDGFRAQQVVDLVVA